jgi:hypothetical protein
MTQLHEPLRSSAPAASDKWAGWVAFGAIMLVITGAINVFQGIVALLDDGYFAVQSGDDLLLVDFTAWGWVMIIWGAVLIAGGVGIFMDKGWARWVAIFAAAGSILLQIGFLAAYPIWSAMIIAFDVFVLLALTVHWTEARRAMG